MIKILITGGNGLVGNALKHVSTEYPNFECMYVNRQDADLTDKQAVENLFIKYKPNYVIHTAARVGGIGRNLNTPVQQFSDNILMNTHMIDSAYKHGVTKFIAFSSVCVFPSNASIITEDILQDSPPFSAHMTYAYAKRMADIQIQAYKLQYGEHINFCSVIPGNIFGEFDNYNLEDGHVIPSLLHKCYLAKKNNTDLVVWGDGQSEREFVYSKDVAKICFKLLNDFNKLPLRLIVSGEKSYPIKEIVDLVCEVSQHNKVFFDTTKPNGQRKRPSDHTLFNKLFPDFNFSDIKDSLKNSYDWFESNYDKARK
jgi:GDP-L-fucose synthase